MFDLSLELIPQHFVFGLPISSLFSSVCFFFTRMSNLIVYWCFTIKQFPIDIEQSHTYIPQSQLLCLRTLINAFHYLHLGPQLTLLFLFSPFPPLLPVFPLRFFPLQPCPPSLPLHHLQSSFLRKLLSTKTLQLMLRLTSLHPIS